MKSLFGGIALAFCVTWGVLAALPMSPVLAQSPAKTPASATSTGSSATLTNPIGAGTTLFVLINRVIKAFLGLTGAFALAVFVYAGITWMTAGSSDRINQAKDAMKYAVMGLTLIAFSYAITMFFLKAFTQDIGTSPTQATPAVEATEFN